MRQLQVLQSKRDRVTKTTIFAYADTGGERMLSITNTMPEAYAKIKGNKKYPNLKGTISFYGVHGERLL